MDVLLDLLNNINNGLDYLAFKCVFIEYKDKIGDIFGELLEIINNFGIIINHDFIHLSIDELCTAILFFEKYSDIIDNNRFNLYINVIKKIYNGIQTGLITKKKYNNSKCILKDLIINFDNYDINFNDSADVMYNKLIDQFNDMNINDEEIKLYYDDDPVYYESLRQRKQKYLQTHIHTQIKPYDMTIKNVHKILKYKLKKQDTIQVARNNINT